MKSKTSCFNKTIFKKNMTHFWPIWVIILLWNLFILPFMIYNTHLNYRDTSNLSEIQLQNSKICDIANLVEVYMNPVLLFLFAVVAAMAVFSYLYTSRAANAMHALPVTRKELFITNYISGLVFLILPEVIGFLMGTLVGALCGYTSLDYLLKGMLFAMGISFSFYTFTVLVGMVTGQLFAVPVFTLIFNLLYVACKLIVVLLLGTISYGMSEIWAGGKLDILSPLYYMTDKVKLEFDYSKSYVVCTGFEGGKIVAGYAVAAVVMLIVAYLIYRKRDMETAGNLLSFSCITPIFRWGVGACAGGLLATPVCYLLGVSHPTGKFAVVTIAAVVFGAIFFFVAQMFLEKGFRVFKKKIVIECGAFAAVLVLALIAIECNLFGQETRMPKESEIEKAYISCNYRVGGSTEEQIKQVREIHSQIIESKKEFERFQMENEKSVKTTYATVKYFLKDGSTFVRGYEIPFTEDVLENSDSVASRIVDLTVTEETYLQNQFCMNYKDITLNGCSLDLYDEAGDCTSKEFTKEEAEILYQAVLTDLESGNMREMLVNGLAVSNKAYQKNTYYNDLCFEFTCKDGIIDSYDEFYQYDRYQLNTNSSNCLAFDKNCKNIIAALMELHAIDSEEDLITIADRIKLEEY